MKAYLLALGLFGCASSLPGKLALVGSSAQLQDGVVVNLEDAVLRAHEVKVKVWVQNLSRDFLVLDQRGLQLKLSDGRVLTPVGELQIYTVPTGGGHEVLAIFRDHAELRHEAQVTLVFGGVSFAADGRARVVGELVLRADGEKL